MATRKDLPFVMRLDKSNAEGMMALASIYYSGQWDKYWKQLRKAS